MSQAHQPSYPWSDTSPIKGNLAIGNLRENLKRLLTTPQGIHVETLLSAAGAVAGFSSQQAFWQVSGLTPQTVPETGLGNELVVVKTLSGERLFFGEGINAYIVGKSGRVEKFSLWAFVRGALIGLGLPPESHPNVGAMFSTVSRAVGTSSFGFPEVSVTNRPHASSSQLLKVLWPHVPAILRLPPPKEMLISERDLAESDWHVVSFIVVNQLMLSTRGHVTPGVAATLVMESAIAASKLEPKSLFAANV